MEILPRVFTSGWASGINAYLVVLILGLADRLTTLDRVPDALQRTDVLVLLLLSRIPAWRRGQRERRAVRW